MKHQRLIAGTLLVAGALNARPVEVFRTWDELRDTIEDRKITLLLPDHTEIQGLARWIEKDSLVMEIRKSSNAKIHPKGLTSVPRDQISTIDMQLSHPRDRGDDEGARIGSLLGTFAAIPAGLAVGSNESLPGWLGWVVFGVAIAGGAFLGHLLTRHSDGHIVIQVIPKPIAHGPILTPRSEFPVSELP